MSTITFGPSSTTVTVTLFERIVSFRGNVTVPSSSVASVDVVDDALADVQGIRAPGLGVPGERKIGIWRHEGTEMFVSVRRGQRAVRVTLQPGGKWATLLIGCDDAASVAASFRPDAAESEQPA